MPELPEVETTCRGIRPHLTGQRILAVEVRERRLRWPVTEEIDALAGQRVKDVQRRAKYILLHCDRGHALIHLGMSGSLRLCDPSVALRKHDHLALSLESGLQLRYHDPRRFGSWLWVTGDPHQHPLLRDLGPEPLGDDFTAAYLAQACKGRARSIKQTIMDARVVVGVGNIYACEALFTSRIHPAKPAGRVSHAKLALLTDAIRAVLARSIEQGGTTLRDFLREDGSPGYFRQQLKVYDRAGQPCHDCGAPIKRTVLGQRSTFFCPRCQEFPRKSGHPISVI
jgi:formamidopyrimidine-DNA glycosylase